jgi:hypothetical protein
VHPTISGVVVVLSAFLTQLAPAPAGHLSWVPLRFAREAPGCGDKPCVSVLVEFPLVQGDTTAVRAINAGIHAKLFPSPPNSGQKLFEELTEDQVHDADATGSRQPWHDHRKATVLLNTAKIFSVLVENDSYLGGAHGSHGRSYANFRPATGAAMALADVVKLEALAKVAALAEKQLRKIHEIDAKSSLTDAGFTFKDGKFTLTDNFGITAEGLVFFYNDYEIAPYAMGPSEIKLPYPDLRGLMREDAGLPGN